MPFKRQPSLPPKADIGHPVEAAVDPSPSPTPAPKEAPKKQPAVKSSDTVQLGTRIDRDLRDRAAGALRYLGRYDEAPRTMQDFTEYAFQLALTRLEQDYNEGQAFPPSPAPLTPGRRVS